MSKIGRKPIALAGVQVKVEGNEVHYKGAKNSGIYLVPAELAIRVKDGAISLIAADNAQARKVNALWGLHRALLANKLKGASADFVEQVQINGLGFKAQVAGSKVVFSLGFSHKIDFDLPKGVALDVDKTGQLLTFKSFDKELLGHVCSQVRALRPPEPYKGTGIKLVNEVIARKAGKTKSS